MRPYVRWKLPKESSIRLKQRRAGLRSRRDSSKSRVFRLLLCTEKKGVRQCPSGRTTESPHQSSRNAVSSARTPRAAISYIGAIPTPERKPTRPRGDVPQKRASPHVRGPILRTWEDLSGISLRIFRSSVAPPPSLC